MFAICINSVAQDSLFIFLSKIKWNCKESDLLKDYSKIIKPREHSYIEYSNTQIDWGIDNIKLGNYVLSASFKFDTTNKKLKSILFNLPEEILQKEEPEILSKNIENLISSKYGKPSLKKDDINNISKDFKRIWYLDDITIEVFHFTTNKSQFLGLSVDYIENNKSDFRVAKWGESKEMIMTKEKKEDKSNSKSIYSFDDKIAGINCDVSYAFVNNKLTMGYYSFKIEHTNKNDYIDDYKNIISLLTDKYGSPFKDVPIWKNSLYKEDFDNYGFAVSIGHLSYNSIWFKAKTNIAVSLHGDNNEIKLDVIYISKQYENLMDGNFNSEDLNKL